MVNYTIANNVGLPAKPTGSPAPAPSQVSLICLGGTRMLYLDGSNGQILGMGYLPTFPLPRLLIGWKGWPFFNSEHPAPEVSIAYQTANISQPFQTIPYQRFISILECWSHEFRTNKSLYIPSGKRLHNYGKSQCSMGKSTINGHFQ